MNKATILIIAVFLIVMGGITFTNKNKSSDTAKSNAFSQIKNDVADGAQLIDVRTPEEYSAGHIELATNLNLVDIQNGVYPSVAKDTKIYLYCHSGNRSGQATKILRAVGYTNITDLGGIESVVSLGANIIK